MTTTKTYAVYLETTRVGTVKATSPTQALRDYFGDHLVAQDGRYGTLPDGSHCSALLAKESSGRMYYGRGVLNHETGMRG